MASSSRIDHAIRNVRTALVFTTLGTLLGFYARRIVIDVLGAELVGLNTTALNLLGFLNISELGVSTIIAYTLYAPLARGDRESIGEIITIQGWIYRRVALFVATGSVVMMALFPFIFAKTELPLWYAYASFGVVLLGSLLSYLYNYQQVLLIADQKQYKVDYRYHGIRLTKIVVQIIGLSYFDMGYKFWLITEATGAIITTLSLRQAVAAGYGWLQSSSKRIGELLERHPEVVVKSKQMIFHRVGGYALYQLSPLIVYAYLSLTAVTIYTNYLLIANGIIMIIGALSNGLVASIGNLVSEGNRAKDLHVFKIVFAFRFWVAAICSYAMYHLSSSFIELWVGEEYLIDNLSLTLLVAYTFVMTTRVSDLFLAAYGLCSDIAAPIIEAAINIGLSLLLGYYFGLSGIIAGVLISLLVVIVGWKSYFLFRRGFDVSVVNYIYILARTMLTIGVAWIVSDKLLPYIFTPTSESLVEWLMEGAKGVILYAAISTVLFSIANSHFRDFIKQTYNGVFQRSAQ